MLQTKEKGCKTLANEIIYLVNQKNGLCQIVTYLITRF